MDTDLRCPMCQYRFTGGHCAVDDNGYCQCVGCKGIFQIVLPEMQPNVVFEGETAVQRQADLESFRREYFLRHLVSLESELLDLKDGRRLMEIGCGSGVLLDIASKKGWQADALELSAELASLAAGRSPKSTIRVVNVLACTSEDPVYDAVMAVDVLEHVTDPHLMLKNCHQMLKPGGLILIQTPNTKSLRRRLQGTDWDMLDPDQHLQLFSREGLTSSLAGNGFEVVRIRTVSGSGMESGFGLILASIKQWTLNKAFLGNALCVIARKRIVK